LFASEESKFAEIYNVPAGPTKQKLFSTLDKIQSADWDLKNKGLIRILEIGCGNGMSKCSYKKKKQVIIFSLQEQT
jgi:hypothetical protein